MPLASNTRIGPYEVTGSLGAGGMGEVYRATDTNLKRGVAIKVLPESVAADAARLARFQREAEVLASLNHPNIAAIYGLERSNGITALVMELVEGPTLADRIAQGALPVEEALPIARQIAEALEAAHDQGIIHRDLKPANIKIRPDGTVKVLDFGLAKALEPPGGGGVGATASPTMTSPAMMTGVGVLLGTAAYVSPEQARGKTVDRRSDIWAFGCVLYEMLTGKRAFEGDDVADVLVSVLTKEPDWDALPPTVPSSVRRLLRRALERDRRRRLADVADARLELEADSEQPLGDRHGSRGQSIVLAVAAAVIAAAISGMAVWWTSASGFRPVARLTIMLPPGQQFTATARQFLAISPDGTKIAYQANDRLFLRSLDRLGATEVAGSAADPANAARVPFFSPDGQWVAFWHSGELKKAAVSSASSTSIARVPALLWGSTWASSGTIFFGQGPAGIWRVHPDGGTPERVVDASASNPQLLPGDQHLLFTEIGAAGTDDSDDARLVVHSLTDGNRHVVLDRATDGRYLRSGHLVYMRDRRLFAVRFALDSMRTAGESIPVVDDVAFAPQSGTAQFSVSDDGTLIYVTASAARTGARQLLWIDRSGHEVPIAAPPRLYRSPYISPDGTRVLFNDDGGVWTYEFRRGIFELLTADEGRIVAAVWSPDSRRIAYGAAATGGYGIFIRAVDGAGDPQRLTTGTHLPHAWSPDGTRIVYVDFGSDAITTLAPSDIAMVALDDAPRTETIVRASGRQAGARLSPDGRWIAYESDETGELAVYVKPFPNTSGGRWRVSPGVGSKPVWSRDGRELLFSTDDSVMAVAIAGDTPADWGTPEQIASGSSYSLAVGAPTFDVASDGRVLMTTRAGQGVGNDSPDVIVVVQNWFEELKRLVPTN
jgi:serine/threonine-protein kinase